MLRRRACLRAISADGRYVAFDSYSTRLPVDTNNAARRVRARHGWRARPRRVSVDSAGTRATAAASTGRSRPTAATSRSNPLASNLVAGDTNNHIDVFVRDTVAGTTTRVSVDSAGTRPTRGSFEPSISADGRYVAFTRSRRTWSPATPTPRGDVFVRDTVAGTTTRVSVDSAGDQANDVSESPGDLRRRPLRRVHFVATNLVAGDTNGTADMFVRDTVAGTTTRVSVDSAGRPGQRRQLRTRRSPPTAATSRSSRPRRTWSSATPTTTATCSCATRWPARPPGQRRQRRRPRATATARSGDLGRRPLRRLLLGRANLVPGDTTTDDVFVRDTVAGTTTRVSVDTAGNQANDDSSVRRSRPTAATSRSTPPRRIWSPATPTASRRHRAGEPRTHGDRHHAVDTAARCHDARGDHRLGLHPGRDRRHRRQRPHRLQRARRQPDRDHRERHRRRRRGATARNVWVQLPGTGPGFGAGALGICAACVTVN